MGPNGVAKASRVADVRGISEGQEKYVESAPCLTLKVAVVASAHVIGTSLVKAGDLADLRRLWGSVS